MNDVMQAPAKEPEVNAADATGHDTRAVSLLVMDRRPLVRECLVRSLGQVWSDGRAVPSDFAVESVTLSEFDLVLIGLAGLHDEGRRRTEGQRLEQLAQSSTTLVLAEDDDPRFVRYMIEIGIRAHISVNQSLRVVSDVLRVVHAGGTYFPTSAFDRSDPVPSLAGSRRAMIEVLTPRELDILRLLYLGKPNKIIAYDLNICDSTVKVHVRHLMSKLGASNRTQVALMAREMLDASY